MTKAQMYEYEEVFVKVKSDPIIVLQNLLQEGVISDYVMYQDGEEVRIGGNMLFKVSVSSEAVTLEDTEKKLSVPITDPFKQVESLLASLPIVDWTAYGYIAFDIVRFYSSYSKAIQQPLLSFVVPETELHMTAQGVKIKSIRSLDQIKKLLSVNSQLTEVATTPVQINFTADERESYQSKVDVLIQAIQAGKLQKAILSRSVKIKGELDVLKTYIAGTKVNNSARSYCLNMGNVRVVGFSPEILMQVDNQGFVITNPLAGTRQRGENSQEDACLYSELFTNAKEVKEHALSVELAQREIAELSVPGTVKIFDFMQVKKYRYVQHLSSRVAGQLKSEKTLWDALKVLFPGITVSGIDKSPALEGIDRLEDEPRGIYAGAIGWINSENPKNAVFEMIRVLRPGGKVAIFYFYLDGTFVNSAFPALTRQFVGFISDSFPSGLIGCQLPEIFEDLGLSNITFVQHTNIVPYDFFMWVCHGILEQALIEKIISESDLNQWVNQLKKIDEAGRFLAGFPGFIVTGQKT